MNLQESLTKQINIFNRPVISLQIFDVVFLNGNCFLSNALVGIGDLAGKKPFPFGIGKDEIIQLFQLLTQIKHQIGFGSDRQILIRL